MAGESSTFPGLNSFLRTWGNAERSRIEKREREREEEITMFYNLMKEE